MRPAMKRPCPAWTGGGELSDFEVVEPVGPLMLFGEGMVLRVRVWGAELTVLFPCDVARFAVSAAPARR